MSHQPHKYPLEPCRSCDIPTHDRWGYVDEGTKESGPLAFTFVECAACQEEERRNQAQQSEAYDLYQRSRFATEEEYQLNLQQEEAYYEAQEEDNLTPSDGSHYWTLMNGVLNQCSTDTQ